MSEVATTPTDEAPAPEVEVADAPIIEGQEQDLADDAGVEGEASDQPVETVEDLEEVEWEGKKAKVPPEIKAALMRTDDYTRKTQAVAEERRLVEAQKEEFSRQAEAQQALLGEYTKLGVVGEQITAMDTELAAYRNADWDAIERADQANGTNEYQRHERAYQRLQRTRDELAQGAGALKAELDQKVKQRALDEQSAVTKRIQEGYAKLPEVIPGWNKDLELKVTEFALSNGVTRDELRLATANPRDIKLLHYARIGFEAEKQQKTVKPLLAAQQTTPTKTVGGAAPAARRTTDSSGDGLSTAEWMRREEQRERELRKQRA